MKKHIKVPVSIKTLSAHLFCQQYRLAELSDFALCDVLAYTYAANKMMRENLRPKDEILFRNNHVLHQVGNTEVLQWVENEASKRGLVFDIEISYKQQPTK